MAKQNRQGPYRAFWNHLPVLKTFLEAIQPGEEKSDDDDAMKRARARLAEVRPSLCDAVDPDMALAVEESSFIQAIDDWLYPDSRCGSLVSLFEDARRVRDGQQPDTAAGRDLAVRACVEQHGGRHCTAGQYLLALFHDCRREGRGHCLGVPLLDGGSGGCEGYARLDDAARRCLATNGGGCHLTDDLDELAALDEGATDDGDQAASDEDDAGEMAALDEAVHDDAETALDEEGTDEDAETSPAGQAAESLVAAIWDWARGWNLVADRAALLGSAAEFGNDPLLPEMVYHRSFLLVVYHTLRAWASSPDARLELSWHVPARDRIPFDDGALGVFHGLPEYVSEGGDSEGPEFVCRQIDSRQDDEQKGDHRRYEIVFRPKKWNPFEETLADAADRIAGELRRHLRRMFEEHHEVLKQPEDMDERARQAGDLVPARSTLNPATPDGSSCIRFAACRVRPSARPTHSTGAGSPKRSAGSWAGRSAMLRSCCSGRGTSRGW
jgi:hypothetical protein